jgi:type II secretory pathway pseudopilin PulG
MVIMAILAAAVLGTAAAAMEAGRRSRTQSTITKIHNLIMDRFAEYETRRVDLNAATQTQIDNETGSARGLQLALERLHGLRELMKYEMPDRRNDFAVNSSVVPALKLKQPPALAQAYFRRYTPAMAVDNEAAECLYMVIMLATGDGEARTLFREQEIGDTDGDGAPEVIDGWGRPIGWMRWPAGFVSPLHSMDAVADHDPFDVYHVEPQAFRIVPLIYSGGPDGRSSMWHSNDITLNPYAAHTGNDGQQHFNGEPVDRNETLDNITNHLIKY